MLIAHYSHVFTLLHSISLIMSLILWLSKSKVSAPGWWVSWACMLYPPFWNAWNKEIRNLMGIFKRKESLNSNNLQLTTSNLSYCYLVCICRLVSSMPSNSEWQVCLEYLGQHSQNFVFFILFFIISTLIFIFLSYFVHFYFHSITNIIMEIFVPMNIYIFYSLLRIFANNFPVNCMNISKISPSCWKITF